MLSSHYFLFQVSLFLNGSMYGMDGVLICQDTWAGTSKVVYTAVSVAHGLG